MLFPTSDTLRGFESAGLAESIKNHTRKNSNVRVKLLLKNQQQQRFSSQVKRSGTTSNTLVGQNNVEVKFASPDKMDTNTALVIADGEKMVTVEFDEKEEGEVDDYSSSLQPNLTDRIRFATHTNSESAIMSHTSIFERLWIESKMK